MDISIGLIIVLVLILWGEFVNGWTDAPNAMATVVSTRVLSPLQAMLMTVVFNLAGVLLAGTAVALTIGKGIVDPSVIDLTTVGAAMLGIIIFSTGAWYFGLPTSESHALISGLAGAGLAKSGTSVLLWAGWKKVLFGLGFSTFLGFLGAFLLMVLIYLLFARIPRHTGTRIFSKAQVFSSAFMAFSHGTNDGQKFVGMFALALMLGGVIPREVFMDKGFQVPFWIIIICAMTMALGTAFGGWKIINTMGLKMSKLEPVNGFAAVTGAAVTIELC
ncbi:MAG: inorganic phosphate transporter, partial [Planctomycetes bacterium]|nr:inorganic phosphate transporter [Planctomycetota bacterium]